MIAAGPLVNIVLALVIFFVLAVGFGLDGDATNRSAASADDLPAAEVLESGDQLVAVDGKRGQPACSGDALADPVREPDRPRTECAGEPTDGCDGDHAGRR